jgi:glucosamine 6-phosphate synthetase-like amidotransferase/phosphosugar isomerase protein
MKHSPIASEGDPLIPTLATHVLWVPDSPWMLSPVVTVIPLQLLAYRSARLASTVPERRSRSSTFRWRRSTSEVSPNASR